MRKICIRLAVVVTFFITQYCLAVEYTAPVDSNPAELRFKNILIDASRSTSAILIATDNFSLHSGQGYTLDINQLGPVFNASDAAYSSVSKQITAQGVVEATDLTHDLTLLFLGVNRDNSNLLNFKLVELRSYSRGPKGDIGVTGAAGPDGPRGSVGMRGSIGLTGAVGATGPVGFVDTAAVYTKVEEDNTIVICNESNDQVLTGGLQCNNGHSIKFSFPVEGVRGLKDLWRGGCVTKDGVGAIPKKVYILCIRTP